MKTTYKNQNRITLKKIKYSDFASQETHCFEATVLFDGVACATVDNDGRGASTDWHQLSKATDKSDKAYRDMQAYIATFDSYQSSFTDGVTIMFTDLSWVCDELVNDWLEIKDMKMSLRKRVHWLEDGKIWQTRSVSARQRDHWIPQMREKYGAENVLNGLPEAEALKLWRMV